MIFVMPNPGRDKRKPCRVKGSSCVKDRWMSRGFDVTTWAELLQGFKGSETKCPLKSKAKTY